ncbi:trypsin-like peptidase domain-containing protein [Streptomyces sp. NPDC006134]|uniref:nSTAND1 domain-containing NTPase n=1 Tax=Streptomyces sp. NPDC006134 TaxID=3154467 RepID=UPI0033E844D3
MRRRYADRSGFIVRILALGTQRAVGTGFLVADDRLLTCAHVVNQALGRDQREQPQPDAELRLPVDFPLLGDADGAPLRSCRLELWVPPPRSGTAGGDIAGLRIVGEPAPAGAGPARLPLEVTPGHGGEVYVFGHPVQPVRRDGSWVAARVRGRVGGGMLQVDAGPDSAVRLQPGYSGSPMVASCPDGDMVVGMLSVASSRDGHRDGYAVPVDGLVRAWPEVLSGIPPSPYRGLRSFTSADEAVFVGREEETAQLERMVADDAAVLVVGPSGIGKSSLVEAGLVPRWRDSGGICVTARPGGSAPLDRLLTDVRVALGDHPGLEPDALRAQVDADGLAEAVSCWARRLGQRILLHVDQFEELLGGTPAGERAALLDGLFPASRDADAALRVVATLRADFLPMLLELPGAGGRLHDRILALSPMSSAALERAVTEPARARGVTYEPGLAAQIAADTGGGPGSLPLMEFSLDRLWPAQRAHRLTFADYRATGGVTGAVNRYAEGVYERLRAEGHAEHVKTVLLALVRSRGGAAEAAAKAVPRARFTDSRPAVDELVRQRLLVAEADGHEPLVRLAHEALIRAWPRYARWVDEDADFQRWLAGMEERAGTDDLLADTRLGVAEHWLAERGDDIPYDVVRLVERSRSAWQRRVAELEAARAAAEAAADTARAAAAEARARQLAAASELATATGVRGGPLPLALAVESLETRWTLAGDTALRHALRTAPLPLGRVPVGEHPSEESGEPHRVFTATGRFSPLDPDLVHSAVYGYDQVAQTRLATYQLFRRGPGGAGATEVHRAVGPALPAMGLQRPELLPYTPDGRAVLQTDARRAVVRDLRTDAVLASDTTGPPLVTARLGDDGSSLLVIRGTSGRGTHSDTTVHGATVRVIDLGTGHVRHETRIDALGGSTAFSADCTLLAATSQWYDGDRHYKWMSKTTVYDLRGERAPVVVEHDGSASMHRAFSPDGALFAAGANSVDSCGDSHTGYVEVFDLEDGGTLLYRHYHYLPVEDLAFAPDGELLAVAIGDSRHRQTPGAGQLIEARSGRERHRLHHDFAVKSVTFNADGSRVAFAGAYTARVFAVHPGDELYAVDHEKELWDIAFHRDGRRLLTLTKATSAADPPQLFESRGAEIARIDHPRFNNGALLCDDGSTLYLSTEHGPWTVDRREREYLDRVVDVLTQDELHVFRRRGGLLRLEFDVAGDRMLVTVGDRSEVHALRGGAPSRRFDHPKDSSTRPARLTADGRRLVTTEPYGSGALLRVVDLARNETVGAVELPGALLAVSDDGRLAAVVEHDEDGHLPYADMDTERTGHCRVAVLRTADGSRLTAFRARHGERAVVFGPAGEWIAALCEEVLTVRDTADGTARWTTETGGPDFDTIVASPAGTHLAATGRPAHYPFSPYPLLLLDAGGGGVLARYEAGATACAFSADGRRFAFCRDGAAEVVDLNTLRPLCTVEHERDPVHDLRFLGGTGARLVTQDARSIRVSEVDAADLLAAAKARTTRELTESERRRHLDDHAGQAGPGRFHQ